LSLGVRPKIKISDNIEKIINPGYKKVYRFYDKETGYAGGDVIVLCDEAEQIKSQKYDVRELQKLIYKDGNLVYQVPTLEESRERCVHELNTIHPETRQIINSREYRVNLSRRLSELKEELLRKYKEEAFEVELHYQKKIGTKK
jgi:nicotinate phosphoribosyltransferase